MSLQWEENWILKGVHFMPRKHSSDMLVQTGLSFLEFGLQTEAEIRYMVKGKNMYDSFYKITYIRP
jgi:hypothetical protein